MSASSWVWRSLEAWPVRSWSSWNWENLNDVPMRRLIFGSDSLRPRVLNISTGSSPVISWKLLFSKLF